MANAAIKGAAIAGALAAMFAGGMAGAQEKTDKQSSKGVKCQGVNACKGQSACATAKNSCSGKNACKGQGFTMVTSTEACTAKGGKVVE